MLSTHNQARCRAEDSTRRPRSWTPAATALALVMVLVSGACRGDDGAAPPASSSAATPTTNGAATDAPSADGVLRIGFLYPATGSQASLGPAMLAAAQLAVTELNDNGGILGQPVELVAQDAGDATTDTASASLDQLSAALVDVIIAPPSSGVTSLVLDQVARSGAVLISAANALEEPPSDVPYVQLAPSLELLGRAVGEHLAAAGKTKTLIVARDDPFGQRVSAAAATALKDAGVAATVQPYNAEAEVYTSDIAAAVAAKPARLVLIGYAELAEFLAGLIAGGATPATVPTFVVSDRLDDALFRRFTQPGALTGVAAIGTGSEVASRQSGFAQQLAAAPATANTTANTTAAGSAAARVLFAAESYDAVVIAALAAARARSDAPAAISDAAAAVTGGQDGDGCADAAACLAVLASGRDTLSYRGEGGPYRLDQDNVATAATFARFPVGTDNKLATGQAEIFRVGDK
ncbi:MAG: ABC transporter substrate-binding protein [Acidimicrobiales bacterium]